MENFSGPIDLEAELILASSDPAVSQAIRRAVKAGKLRKIAARIYTSNLVDEPADIIHRHRYYILGQLFPTAVISHRSALEGGFAKDNSIVLTYKYTKNIQLPGMLIRLVKGEGALEGDTAFLDGLSISSRARALLENLQPSRMRSGLSRTLSREKLEERLDKIIRVYGEDEVNRLRDEAKIIADRLGLKKELQALEKLIGALLGTRKEFELKTGQGKARAIGQPYDTHRFELFTTLANHLNSAILANVPSTLDNRDAQRNFAFFEAYFSNFIEGTEFEIDEAEDIIFHSKIIPNRADDSHDILGTYKIVSNQSEMKKLPTTPDDFMHLLKKRHGILLEARSAQLPGQFKDKVNRAGNTVFVKPDEVMGTLRKGLEIYLSLEPGIKRAMYMMFIVSEVHPFLDGNGRIARVMMNAELASSNQCKIIIPTVYREDYLLAIRRLSRQADPAPYVRMLGRAQQFSASIEYTDYKTALQRLKQANAFARPHEAKLIIP